MKTKQKTSVVDDTRKDKTDDVTFEILRKTPDFYKTLLSLDHSFVGSAFDSSFPTATKEHRRILIKQIIELQIAKSKIDKEEEPLVVGVVGQFKTGKSTLINSLIGGKEVVMDSKPATAKVTSVRYGDSKRYWKIDSTGSRVDISEEAYRAESSHEYGEKNVRLEGNGIAESFEIGLPSEVLRDITIVDTPGFSSESESDDNTTKSWLNKIDLFLWVFDINKGSIQSDEKRLLDTLGDKHIVAVLNRSDQKDISARKRLMERFSNGHRFERVFMYSALKALEIFEPRREVISHLRPENLLDRLRKDKQVTIRLEQDRLLISNSEKDGNEVSLRSPIDDGEWDELRMILTTYLKGIKSKINELKLARWRADVSQLLSQEIKSWRGLCAVLTKTAHVMKGEFSPWEAIKRVKNNAGTEFTISNGDLVDTLYGKMFEHGVEEHALGSDVAWVEYRYPTDYVLRSTVGSKFKKFTEEWVGSFSRSISKVDEVTVDRINAYMEDFVEIAWQGLHVMHIAWEDITEDNEGSVTVGVDDEELEHYKENVLKQEITYAIPFEQLYNIIDRTLSEYIEQKRAQELERLNNVRNQVRLLVNEVEDRFSPLKD